MYEKKFKPYIFNTPALLGPEVLARAPLGNNLNRDARYLSDKYISK